MRDVENINTSHPKASRYLDVKENGEVDKETEALLTDLRESIIPNNLQSENIHRFRTQWTDNGGINEEEHKDYLKVLLASLNEKFNERQLQILNSLVQFHNNHHKTKS